METSIGARSLLIKSVLGALGTYYMSVFIAPVSVVKRLEQIRSRIFWRGSHGEKKMHWANWNLVLAPKEKGNSVWQRMVKDFRKLHESGIVPFNSIHRQIRCGNETKFWKHIWCQHLCLAEKFPRLFALELDKECLVVDRVAGDAWKWRRDIRGGAELAQLVELSNLLADVSLD
ncbi:hypothetical protein L1987_06753 [Smallanthus sonchifolius]|uniref:Uncharacterized protein n=1 Tax=Smallanthus sonchifolius TaxID=185202 RepID=A0ACB9JZ61_9ASTR|nr:hypothetical protein L1987_06753 [Smallanthus sonchifolius]